MQAATQKALHLLLSTVCETVTVPRTPCAYESIVHKVYTDSTRLARSDLSHSLPVYTFAQPPSRGFPINLEQPAWRFVTAGSSTASLYCRPPPIARTPWRLHARIGLSYDDLCLPVIEGLKYTVCLCHASALPSWLMSHNLQSCSSVACREWLSGSSLD